MCGEWFSSITSIAQALLPQLLLISYTSQAGGGAPTKVSAPKHCCSQKSKSSAVLRRSCGNGHRRGRASCAKTTRQEMVPGPRTPYPSPARPRHEPRRGARAHSGAAADPGLEDALRRSRRRRPRGRTAAKTAGERTPRGRTAARPQAKTSRTHRGENRGRKSTQAKARAGHAAHARRRARAGHAAHAQEPPARRGGARGPRVCNHRAHWECGNESSSKAPLHGTSTQVKLSTAHKRQLNFRLSFTPNRTDQREYCKCFANQEM
jgi:hypothetical protein